MSLIDILRGDFAPVGGNPVAITDYGSFTANNAVAKVNTNVAAATWRYIFRKADGKYLFNFDDNFTVLSAGVMLPYHFSLADGFCRCAFSWYDSAGGSGIITPLSSPDGVVQFPAVNAEYSIGAYCPYPSTGKTVMIRAALDGSTAGAGVEVSMIGAPALLNGSKFYPQPFIKVLHNLAMI